MRRLKRFAFKAEEKLDRGGVLKRVAVGLIVVFCLLSGCNDGFGGSNSSVVNVATSFSDKFQRFSRCDTTQGLQQKVNRTGSGTYEQIDTLYTVADCSGTPLTKSVLNFTISFSGEQEFSASTVSTAVSLFTTLYTPGDVAGYNGNAECGYTDWALGIAKDCSGTPALPTASVYDIMKIENARLYLGDKSGALDGSTLANQPNTYDLVNYFEVAP